MVKLKTLFQTNEISAWWSNKNNQIAFSRENKYLFIFNREDYPVWLIPRLNLKPGIYRSIFNNERLVIEAEQDQIGVSLKPKSFQVFIKE